MTIETAGTIDLDVELKFTIDDRAFSIDVRKDFLEPLKDIYKALTRSRSCRSATSRRAQRPAHARAISSMYKLNTAQETRGGAAVHALLDD